jgi:hypothetical protein
MTRLLTIFFLGKEPFESHSVGLKALCTTRHIKHRGDTLNKPTITVELSSPDTQGLRDVLELKATHFKVEFNSYHISFIVIYIFIFMLGQTCFKGAKI